MNQEAIKQHLLAKMPENLKNAFERVTVAGMKLFYSKDIQSQLMDDEDSGQPLAHEIGVTAMGMISMLQNKSNNTIPPAVLIPAGVFMIVSACEFMDETGKFPDLNDKVVGDAIEVFIISILQKNGIDQATAQKLAEQVSSQVEGGGNVAIPTQAKPQAGLLQKGAQ